jgi:hypothetical protein
MELRAEKEFIPGRPIRRAAVGRRLQRHVLCCAIMGAAIYRCRSVMNFDASALRTIRMITAGLLGIEGDCRGMALMGLACMRYACLIC